MTDKDEEFTDTLVRYTVSMENEQILAVLREEDVTEHYSITIIFADLYDFNMELVETLLANPYQVLNLMDVAVITAQRNVLDEFTPSQQQYMSVKSNCHMRITGLMNCPELVRNTLPRSNDLGKFLSVTGTLIRSSLLKVLEFQREYICSKCKKLFTIEADFNQYYTITKPTSCKTDGCKSNAFTATNMADGQPRKCRNYQEIKIQEQIHMLPVGSVPRSMWVVLEDDIVDTCKPGDDLIITGILEQRWKKLSNQERCDIEMVMRANSIQVINEQSSKRLVTDELVRDFEVFWREHTDCPMSARNKILASICPQVYGLYAVKLSVCLTLIGGLRRSDDSGTQVRGEIHLLLVGDPGTGKSQFLKYAHKVIPRSVFTTGIGSTSAGLTVTAMRDSGEWQLEAGALVLADGGVCCIDEFSSIREQDKTSIHEAMEQQTISVAKAGMVCKLNTRCAILAATNPKGKYDVSQDICLNIALASPLLSRFDIVLVLLDNQNDQWDKVVSDFVLLGKHPLDGSVPKELWTLQKIQAYISHTKLLKPRMTTDASMVLQAYYKAQRNADSRDATRTTMRLLQSLIRLSQAHARLMYRETVFIVDCINAIIIVESSMQGAALFGEINALHTAFPQDAEKEYKLQADLILKTLKLDDLRTKELDRLQRDSGRNTRLERDPLTNVREKNTNVKRDSRNIATSEVFSDLDPPTHTTESDTSKSTENTHVAGRLSKAVTHEMKSVKASTHQQTTKRVHMSADDDAVSPRGRKSRKPDKEDRSPRVIFKPNNVVSSTQVSPEKSSTTRITHKTSEKAKSVLKKFLFSDQSTNHSVDVPTNLSHIASEIIGLSNLSDITDKDLELD